MGGGDSALEEATYLTKFASEVVLVHRRDELRGSKIMQDYANAKPNLSVLTPSSSRRCSAPTSVASRARACATRSPARSASRSRDGMFVAIGHTPNTGLFRGILDMDENGYLTSSRARRATKIPGVFAAGDVVDHVYRQAITAAGWAAGGPRRRALADRGDREARQGERPPPRGRRALDGVLHLPQLRSPLHRLRRPRGPHAPGRRLPRCGFGFLFELLEDFFPAPTRACWRCDRRPASSRAARASSSSRATRRASRTARALREALGLGFDGERPDQRRARVGRAADGEDGRLRHAARAATRRPVRRVPGVRRRRRRARALAPHQAQSPPTTAGCRKPPGWVAGLQMGDPGAEIGGDSGMTRGTAPNG